MENVFIRRSNYIDIDSIVEIENSSFTIPWSRASFEKEIMDNDLAYYLVLVFEKKVIGYAGMWIIVDEAHVTNIALLPEFRGKGLGRKLVTELLELARNKGALSISLEVRKTNEIAQKLYTSLGFVANGIRKEYYTDNKEDAIVMIANLS